MPWVSIVLTTFWTRLLYLDDPETLDAKLGHAAKEASDELSAIALRYAVIDGKELAVAKEAARTRPVRAAPERFRERLARRQHAGVQVAAPPHALEHDRHRVDRRVRACRSTSSQRERRRDGRARLRSHRVGGGDRLPFAVLVRVDQHAAPPAFDHSVVASFGCARAIAPATCSANRRVSS